MFWAPFCFHTFITRYRLLKSKSERRKWILHVITILILLSNFTSIHDLIKIFFSIAASSGETDSINISSDENSSGEDTIKELENQFEKLSKRPSTASNLKPTVNKTSTSEDKNGGGSKDSRSEADRKPRGEKGDDGDDSRKEREASGLHTNSEGQVQDDGGREVPVEAGDMGKAEGN